MFAILTKGRNNTDTRFMLVSNSGPFNVQLFEHFTCLQRRTIAQSFNLKSIYSSAERLSGV